MLFLSSWKRRKGEAVWPDIDTSDGVLTRIKFYISENQLKVAWTSYGSVGNGDWEYLEKKAYEIPLAESAFQ